MPQSVPGEPVNEGGWLIPYRIILAYYESLHLASRVYAETDEVAESRMAQGGKSLLMLQAGEYQYEQKYSQDETAENSMSKNHRHIVPRPGQRAR